MILLPILLFSVVLSVHAEDCNVGDIELKDGLNVTQLLGTWHDILGSDYTTRYKCTTAKIYEGSATTAPFEVTFYDIQEKKYLSAAGQIRVINGNSFIYDNPNDTVKYYVLGLDPEKYLIMTGCQRNKVNTYVVAHQKSLDSETLETVKKILEQNDRSIEQLKPFEQFDCPSS